MKFQLLDKLFGEIYTVMVFMELNHQDTTLLLVFMPSSVSSPRPFYFTDTNSFINLSIQVSGQNNDWRFREMHLFAFLLRSQRESVSDTNQLTDTQHCIQMIVPVTKHQRSN